MSSPNAEAPWWQEWLSKMVCIDTGPPEPARMQGQQIQRAVEGEQSEWASAASAAAKVEAARTAAQGAWAFARCAATDAEQALTKALKAVETAQERRDAAMRKDRIATEAADKAYWALSAMGYEIGDYDTNSESRSETEEILSRVNSKKSYSVHHASEEIQRIKTASDGRMDIVKTTRTGTVMCAIIENADARCEEIESLKHQLEQAKREKKMLQLMLKDKDEMQKSSEHSLREENKELMAEVGRLRLALLEEKKAHKSARSSFSSPAPGSSVSSPPMTRPLLSHHSSPMSLPPADLS